MEPDAQTTDGSSPSPDVRDTGIHPRPPSPRSADPRRWKPSNLTLRLFTAAILIPPLLLVSQSGGWPFVMVVVVFNCVGINEFYNFISSKGANAHRLLGTSAAALIPVIFYVGDAFLATSFMTAVLLGTMILQLTKREIREAIASVSATFFGIFYVAWLFSHTVSVRFIQPELVDRYGGMVEAVISPQIGFFFIVLCMAGAVGCDTGAYFVGRKYGRHRLAPSISPGKTIEGALGGVVAGAIFAVLTKAAFDYGIPGVAPGLALDFSYASAAAFGTVIAMVGILGDLIESVLKRDAQLKDAGSVLPGVGGVLDRVDSALLAFPVMYYMLLAHYYFRFS